MTDIVDFDVRPTAIGDLFVLTMKQVADGRGTVREFYRASAFQAAGLTSFGPWVQVNVTETRPGAVRGMHGEHMHKLVAVAAGEAFGAYVDTRPDSPSRGKLETVVLGPGVQVLVPPGVCNGFQATAPGPTQYVYCFDEEWRPDMPGVSCTPLDPDLAIPWPLAIDPDDPTQISVKDRDAPAWRALAGGDP